jgi:cyclic-di-GMP phosphodiesterase, flagellum assembly factor TipF
MRPGAIFVAICMVLIACSAGGVVYLGIVADPAAAIMVAVVVLTALGVYNTVATRQRAPNPALGPLADLSRVSADLARQIGELGRRQAALESQTQTLLEHQRAVVDPLTAEMGELGTLVKELAETAASHETTLTSILQALPTPTDPVEPPAARPAVLVAAPAAPATAQPVAAEPSEPQAATKPPVAATTTELPPPAPPSPASDDALLATLRNAIEATRIDLFLQPIVTLPQRKVRYYEAMSRLRSETGEVLQAADFIPPAERGGLMPKIDNLVVFRCVQVIRRLLVKNREIGLFCNLSGATLIDGTVFPQMIEFLEANRAIAPSVVFEFTQSFLRTAGPIENEALAALAERGFRFSLDNVTDLRLEPRELATRGFRFIKIPATLLLGRVGGAASDIHPADLSDLLGRFGVDLIAERIESEGMAVDLLDYDVRFGQGFLFSPPRPVRAEALQGIAERGDLIVRENAAAAAPATSDIAKTPAPPAPEPGKRTSTLAQLVRGRV